MPQQGARGGDFARMKNEPNNRINTIAYLVRRFILHMIIQSLVVGQSDASATAQYTRGEQKEKEGRRLKNIRLHVEDHEHLTRGPVLRGREIKLMDNWNVGYDRREGRRKFYGTITYLFWSSELG